jgi:hypothetical protein
VNRPMARYSSVPSNFSESAFYFFDLIQVVVLVHALRPTLDSDRPFVNRSIWASGTCDRTLMTFATSAHAE